MKLTKLKSLFQEFPFLEELLREQYNITYYTLFEKPLSHIALDVAIKRMNEDLMYYAGENPVDGRGAYLHIPEKKLKGTSVVSIFFANQDGVIYENKNYHCSSPFLYVPFVECAKKYGYYPKYIIKHVKYTWYYEKNENWLQESNVSSIDHNIQIYKLPKSGIEKMIDPICAIKKLTMTQDLLLHLFKKDHDLYNVLDNQLCALVEKFTKFFEDKLQYKLYIGPERAFVYEYNDIVVRTLTLAGRVMVTLENTKTKDQITFKGEDVKEGPSNMGCNSINATLSNAEILLDAFLQDVKSFSSIDDVFLQKSVGFAGQSFGA